MTIPFDSEEQSFHLNYLGIKKVYTDFTPEMAVKIMETRPDGKKRAKDCLEDFRKIGTKITLKPGDNNFEQLKEILEPASKSPFSSKAPTSKLKDKLFKKKEQEPTDN